MSTKTISADGGALFEAVARATGLSAAQSRDAMEKLCPAIAAAMNVKAKSDPDLHDSLLDLLEDNGADFELDDPEDLTGAEAIADGATILEDVYGSRAAAMAEMRFIAGDMPEAALSKLAAISATSVVAALATSGSNMMTLTGAQQAVGGGGIISILIDSFVKAAVQSATRQLAPKRRRRSYTTRRRTRRTSTRRKTTTALEDIFGAILGSTRK